MKAVTPILVPLFVSSFNRADELANAMEARGYQGGRQNEIPRIELAIAGYAESFGVCRIDGFARILPHQLKDRKERKARMVINPRGPGMLSRSFF